MHKRVWKMRRLFLSLAILLYTTSMAMAERDCVGIVYYAPNCDDVAHFSCQVMDVGGTPINVDGYREVSFRGVGDLDHFGPYLLLRVWDFDGVSDTIYDFPGSDKFIGIAGSVRGLHVVRINIEENGGPPEVQAVDHRFSSADIIPAETFTIPSEFVWVAAAASDIVLWRYQGFDRMALTAAVQLQYVFDPCR